MADLLTLAASIDKHHLTIVNKFFILTFLSKLIFRPDSELVSMANGINGKDLRLVDWNLLDPVTEALVDGQDVEAKRLSDNESFMTPVEWGNAVAFTKLSSLQTGGAVDTAAPKLVAENAANSVNMLGINRLRQTTNAFLSNDKTAMGDLTADDVLNDKAITYAFNRLNRNDVPRMPSGHFLAVSHADVMADLKDSSAWINAVDYGNHVELLAHEVGMYKGFRFIDTTANKPIVDGGSGSVDAYETIFTGAGGLAYTYSLPIRLVMSPGTDKLKRTMNVGWYGVYNFDIFKEIAVWKCISASAYGTNV